MLEVVTHCGRRLRLLATPPVEGGEAVVYRGVGPSGEDVAVKVSRVPGAEGAWLPREAALQRALAQLPGLAERVVPVLGEGVWQGRPFLVRPWLPGTLEEAARDADPATRQALARSAAEAVAALHAAEPALLHRDIKPANLLVDARGAVWLSDLGAARRLRPGATTTMSALRTPGYAAPELALPGACRPGRGQDLYALAATVYAVLVGRPPRAVAWNHAEVLRTGRLDEGARLVCLTPGDRRALARAGASPALVEHLEDLLAPWPAQRRGTAERLAALLARPRPAESPSWGLLGAGLLLAGLALALAAPPAGPARYPAVVVPPGAYPLALGDRLVVLEHPLLVGEAELTQGLWRRLMHTDAARQRRRTQFGGLVGSCDSLDGLSLVGDHLPAVCLQWLDAVRVANALSRADGLRPAYELEEPPGATSARVTWDRTADGWRLPTNDEWEALAGELVELHLPALPPGEACTLGNVGDERFGARFPQTPHAACDDGVAGLAPVARYRPSARGLYDLLGNAAEWTWEEVAPGRHRVRGLSWAGDPGRVDVVGEEGVAEGEVHLTSGVRLVRSLR